MACKRLRFRGLGVLGNYAMVQLFLIWGSGFGGLITVQGSGNGVLCSGRLSKDLELWGRVSERQFLWSFGGSVKEK